MYNKVTRLYSLIQKNDEEEVRREGRDTNTENSLVS
jgi:hypothetical protein